MFLVSEKRWPRLILTAYFSFSIIGIFTFMEMEPLRSFVFLEDRPASGASLSSADHTSLTEGAAIISKAGEYSFSLLRNEHPRVLMPFGTKSIGPVLSQSALKAIEKANYLSIKDTIPLKLLI
jgi:hypothetical protein